MEIGRQMYDLCARLFSICRSITGDGVRKILAILREIVLEMTVHEVPLGTSVFDWMVPKKWNIRDVWIKNSRGEKILDFQETNLHVVGYSFPVIRVPCRRILIIIHSGDTLCRRRGRSPQDGTCRAISAHGERSIFPPPSIGTV